MSLYLVSRRNAYNLDVKRQRLLAHDMQPLLNGSNGMICVDCSNTSNDYSIQVFFLEHLIVVFINSCSCEVFCCPFVLVEIRRACCYNLGTRSKNVIVQCVSLACFVSIEDFRIIVRTMLTHSAKTGNTDAQLGG